MCCVPQTAVRNICGYLQDTFQILMSQMQNGNPDMEANPSSPLSAPKRKKSRKLSRAEKKQTKLALKAAEKTKAEHLPVTSRISSDSTHSFDFYKTTDVKNLSDISSIDSSRPSVDLTASPMLDSSKQSSTEAPRPESLIDKQFSFLNHSSSGGNLEHPSNASKSQKQRKVGRDMSRQQYQKKSVKADALLKKLEGSLMLHGKENGVIQELNENEDDELVSPLKQHTSQVFEHSGEVKKQQQLDREGQVITPKYTQYSLPANVRKRSSILTDIPYERSTLPLTGKSPSKSRIAEYDSEFSTNSLDDKEHVIDGKEEQDGDEHEDNGDGGDDDVSTPTVTYPPPIINATLPDLETEITTPPPFYKPPFDETVTELAAGRTRSSPVTESPRAVEEPPNLTTPTTPTMVKSSSVSETPPVDEEPPIIEEPSPPKKQRKPWSSMFK